MSYSRRIDRKHPTCFLFLIDQSISMAEKWSENYNRKADASSLILNRLLLNLVIECSKDEGIRDYFYIGAIGYGENVKPGFAGTLVGKELIPISQLADNPLRIEERVKKTSDGVGGIITQKVKMPVWFDAVADGNTPMCQEFDTAYTILTNWMNSHPDSFPPVVFNITDGVSTDGDPIQRMEKIKGLASDDGNVVLFNLHISTQHPLGQPFPLFPDNINHLGDPYASNMFNGTSYLPPPMLELARQKLSLNLSNKAKAFTLNAPPEHIIEALNIGTSTQLALTLRQNS